MKGEKRTRFPSFIARLRLGNVLCRAREGHGEGCINWIVEDRSQRPREVVTDSGGRFEHWSCWTVVGSSRMSCNLQVGVRGAHI